MKQVHNRMLLETNSQRAGQRNAVPYTPDSGLKATGYLQPTQCRQGNFLTICTSINRTHSFLPNTWFVHTSMKPLLHPSTQDTLLYTYVHELVKIFKPTSHFSRLDRKMMSQLYICVTDVCKDQGKCPDLGWDLGQHILFINVSLFRKCPNQDPNCTYKTYFKSAINSYVRKY